MAIFTSFKVDKDLSSSTLSYPTTVGSKKIFILSQLNLCSLKQVHYTVVSYHY